MADSYSVNAVFGLKDGLSSKLRTIKGNMEEVAQKPKKISMGLGSILKSAGVFSIVNKGFSLMSDNIGGAVQRFDKLNNFPKVMKAMGASTDDSKKALDKMSDAIDGLPTSLDEIASTAQKLFPIVKNNIGKASDSAIALNNAFLASGASAGDASRGLVQYTQMLSAGKVDMQSWKSLQETMPYALQQTAKSFGIADGSSQKLYAQLKDGKITMEQLNDRFIQLNSGTNGFAVVARQATGGIGTAFINLGNRVKKGLADMIQSFDELSVKITGSSIAAHISDFGNLINKILVSVSKSIKDLGDRLKPYFDILKSSFSEMGVALGQAFSAVGESLGKLGGNFLSSSNSINGFKSAMANTSDIIVNISNYIRDNADEVANLIVLLPKLVIAWQAIKVGKSIFESVGGSVIQFSGKIKKLSTAFTPVSTAMSAFKIKFSGIFASLVQDAGVNKFRAVFMTLNSMIVGMFPNIDRFSYNMQILKRQMVTLGEGNVFTRPFQAFNGAVMTTFPKMNSFTQGIKNMGTTAIHPIRSISSAFTSTAASLGGNASSMKVMLTMLGNGFKSMSSVGISAIQKLGAAFLTNPVGLAITEIIALVVAFVIAWKNNFMNIQQYTKVFFDAIGRAFSSIGNMIRPAMQAVKPLEPMFSGLAKIIGGTLLIALGAIAVALAVVVDAFRFVIAVVATTIISISALLNAIGKAGSAVGKFFQGDFKGAAKDAKGSVDSVGDGINKIKDTWGEFAKGSATAGVIDGFSKVGKETDKTADKAKMADKAFKGLGEAGKKAGEAISENMQKASQSMQSAFTTDRMQKFTASSSQLMEKFASDSKVAYDAVAEISKAKGDERVKATEKAMSKIATVEKEHNGQMNAIISDNTKMLVTNKDLEGKQLTAEQRKSLQEQNQAIRDELTKQEQLYVNAAKSKLTTGKQLSEAERNATISNLNASYLNQQETINANEQRLAELKKQKQLATTETEKANYQAQIDTLKSSNEQMLLEQQTYGQQMNLIIANGGQLNFATWSQGLQNMKNVTAPQLQSMYLDFVQMNSNTGQQMQAFALMLQRTGTKGVSNLTQVLSTGKATTKQIMEAIAKDGPAGLNSLPANMFKKGNSGKNSFINALKKGDFKGAGKYLATQSANGASDGDKKHQKAGDKNSKTYAQGVEKGKADAKKAGEKIAKSGVDGTKSKKSDYKKAGESGGKSYNSGIKSSNGKAKKSGESLAKSAKSGAKGVSFNSVGANMAKGVAAGITKNTKTAVQAMEDLVAKVNKAAKKKAKIKSPSRLLRDEVGKYLSLGVAQGIEDHTQEAMDATDNLIDSTNRQINQGLAFGLSADSDLTVNTDNDMINMLRTIVSSIKEGKEIRLYDDTLVGATAPMYDKKFGEYVDEEERWSI